MYHVNRRCIVFAMMLRHLVLSSIDHYFVVDFRHADLQVGAQGVECNTSLDGGDFSGDKFWTHEEGLDIAYCADNEVSVGVQSYLLPKLQSGRSA